jgi:hypothetical protein
LAAAINGNPGALTPGPLDVILGGGAQNVTLIAVGAIADWYQNR